MARQGRTLQCFAFFVIGLIGTYCAHIRVCPGDDLELNCSLGEVIVPTSASFGRMEFTECTIAKDFIGCENDVLYLVDRWCSGRMRCTANVPNNELVAANKACLPYMRKYLEITYYCAKVISGDGVSCEGMKTPQTDEGIISSHACASVRSSWRVQAMVGQTIQLNIVDFGSEQFNVENKTDNFPVYGFVKDGRQRTEIKGGLERERLLYQSKSNELLVQILPQAQSFRFLIRYQKFGCPDLTPPAHAWYKRDGDQAVIGCEWSQKTWHLSCDGHSWSGVVGNCSEIITISPPAEEIEVSHSSALWLVCVVSVSVVIMVVACVAGVVCIKKYRIKQDVQKSILLHPLPGQGHYDLDPNIEMASMLYLPYKSDVQQEGTLSDPQRPASYLLPQDQVVSELTPIRIWERPLPELPDKSLPSGPSAACPTVRSGRTPGDGDEAVSNSGVQESDTLSSQPSDFPAKPFHGGQDFSALNPQSA